MRNPIASTAALLLIAAVAPAQAQEARDASPRSQASTTVPSDEPLSAMPSYEQPTVVWRTYEEAQAKKAICRDRIHKAREQMGQPPLDREPATGDEPMAIWAVDRREDGCAVLVAMGNPKDIRPIPQIKEYHGLRPAK